MRNLKLLWIIVTGFCSLQATAQEIKVSSPDNQIAITISNGEQLRYDVSFKERSLIKNALLGFELKGEPKLSGDFMIMKQELETIRETWIPVVRSCTVFPTSCNEKAF